MKSKAGITLLYVFITLFLTAAVLGACGNSKKEAGPSAQPVAATQVGSQSCINQCHAATKDIFGEEIAVTWQTTTHTVDFGVQCEDCHGGGSLHWGVGPIPFPNPPAAPCNACHHKDGFDGTRHANANMIPDSTFSQITTTASFGRHIEECSVCHNPDQRFEFGFEDVFVKPNPNNLPNPEVACAGCHWGGHQPVDVTTTVPQRGNGNVFFPLFRPFTVDLSTGAQTTAPTGTTIMLSTFQPNGAVQPDGSVNLSKVTGTNNELHVEQLCGACHAQGVYKNSGGPTHQEDIFGEWTQSAHGTRNDPAFAEFSANPTTYINPNTGLNYTPADAGHQSLWPYDMSFGSTIGGGGSVFSTATATANAGVVGATGVNDNFPCYRCHNGLTSIVYQDDEQGTPNAPVIFGDEPVICITCHDPHTDVPGQTKNTRKPVVMSKYSSAQVTFSGNVFFDNTPVPGTTGNATVCVFCHQGRESGFTLFKRKLAQGQTITGNFFNPHYLGTAAMLWAKNGYELSQVSGTIAPGPVTTPKMYGMVPQHQQTNCFGCHMTAPVSSPTGPIGGHTWKIVSDDDSVVNSGVTTAEPKCNNAACHNGRMPVTNASGEFDNFRDMVFDPTNDYDGNGSPDGIPVEIMGLENQVIGLLTQFGIFYDDVKYPYFFTDATFATNFTAWTLPPYKAAFNLSFVVKGLPSGPTQINQPNASASCHNFRYNIQLLHDSYENLWNSFKLLHSGANPPGSVSITIPGGSPITVTLHDPAAMVRPSSPNDRPATNYNPQSGGTYDPRQ